MRAMLLDDDFPSLESLAPARAGSFEQRLAALEGAVAQLGLLLDWRLADRVRRLEEDLASQEADRRGELGRESAARNEQFAKLAMKLSRRMDLLHFPLDGDSAKSSPSPAADTAVLLERRIDEAFGCLACETAGLRSEIRSLSASLEGLADTRKNAAVATPGPEIGL